MIAIINVSPDGVTNAEVHTYRLQINKKLIATFKHRRADGLATCLRKAADAAEKHDSEWRERIIVALGLERPLRDDEEGGDDSPVGARIKRRK